MCEMSDSSSSNIPALLPAGLLIDAHQDIAYNALEWQRDIRHSAFQTREREAREHPDYCNPDAAGGIWMSGLPELRQAGCGIIFSTLFAYPRQAAHKEVGKQYSQTQTYRISTEAARVADSQLAYYQELREAQEVSFVKSKSDLSAFLIDWWQAADTGRQRPVGLVLLMEGADPIGRPSDAEYWYARGVRCIGPAWNTGSRYAGGNVTGGPLTRVGRGLLAEMDRLGIALDTSHFSEESFWQALDTFQGHLLASHSNCRAIVPRQRELSDEMIRALAKREGVIGMSPFNGFLVPGWSQTRTSLKLERLVAHIDHVCQLLGDAHHVGIGTDIDGGFGRDETPEELDTIADLPRLGGALKLAGYSSEDVGNILGGNWLGWLKRSLPQEDEAG
jgi:membrane dipeptidase